MYAFGKKFAATLPLMFLAATTTAFAQEPNPTTAAPSPQSNGVVTEGPNGMYIYHVKVVEHDLDAVNYLNHSGSTHVSFQGTELMPGAHGDGKIDPQTGKMHVQVKFEGLTSANSLGNEYLTYVLWAISADGRPINLGELELAGNKASLNVTVPFQSFGMIVTAEPYYAVSAPSDAIVLRNVFDDRTQGVLQQVKVHYALLPRGIYSGNATPGANENPITDREHYPLALYEAHAAVRTARAAGADKYAADIMREVYTDMKNAEDMQNSKHRDVKMIFTYARSATQRSEDARIVTLRKQAAERDRMNVEAKENAQAQAAAAQQQAANAQQEAAASQLAAANAQAAAERAAAEKAKADADRARAEADAANARAEAAAANQNAQKNAEDANAVREKLRAQLNAILVTSESARGLIVNMSDVLFDTGKYTLKQGTQVSLAKVATILQLYPGLKIQVEGYTDSVGGDDYNQKLSENRANAVHDFLVANGVPAANVTAAGYGKSNPVADNSTAEGRQQNRRVNMVVSGDAIGVQTSAGPQ